jgi:hypothetical protein
MACPFFLSENDRKSLIGRLRMTKLGEEHGGNYCGDGR